MDARTTNSTGALIYTSVYTHLSVAVTGFTQSGTETANTATGQMIPGPSKPRGWILTPLNERAAVQQGAEDERAS